MTKTIKNIIILYLLSFLINLILFKTDAVSQVIFNSILYALIINFVNSVIAFYLLERSLKMSNKNYMLINLGSMIVRLFFILAAVAFVIKFLEIHKIGFILVLFIYYFVLLAIEVFYSIIKAEKHNNSWNS